MWTVLSVLKHMDPDPHHQTQHSTASSFSFCLLMLCTDFNCHSLDVLAIGSKFIPTMSPHMTLCCGVNMKHVYYNLFQQFQALFPNTLLLFHSSTLPIIFIIFKAILAFIVNRLSQICIQTFNFFHIKENQFLLHEAHQLLQFLYKDILPSILFEVTLIKFLLPSLYYTAHVKLSNNLHSLSSSAHFRIFIGLITEHN